MASALSFITYNSQPNNCPLKLAGKMAEEEHVSAAFLADAGSEFMQNLTRIELLMPLKVSQSQSTK